MEGRTMEGRTTVEGASGTGTFTSYTAADGLTHPTVRSITQDREGRLWFGTWGGGISRFDGDTFATYAEEGGAENNMVWSGLADREGRLWFGTWSTGVRCYDPSAKLRAGGKEFSAFTIADGLASNYMMPGALQDREGHLWFATDGGGANRYDGTVFQVLTTQDGLSGNVVRSIFQDREGALWFATNGGVTRFRPPTPTPPDVFIEAVVADHRYEGIPALDIPSTVRLTAFEFDATSFKTRPGQMVFRYRLRGVDRDWKTTLARRVEYEGLPRGAYTFEVQAVDRDLVYSERPAVVTLRVHLPYVRVGLIVALGIAVALVVYQTVRVVQRDRRLREANLKLDESNRALSAGNKELFSLNLELQQKTEALEESNQELEKATEAAERANRAKSVFLSHMSHEIRTPMTAILGYAQILRGDPELSARHRRAVEVVEVSGTRLLSMINDVLDLSRIEAGRESLNPEDFDLSALIEELSAMFALTCKQKGLEWAVEGPEGRVRVRGDRQKLGQALINLLGNAVKFTEEGEVGLRVRAEGGDRYAFEVRDTGPGISPEGQAAIFEAFEQGDLGGLKGGTGLGLTIARRHVALMGGELRLDSEPGLGAVFTFTLCLPEGSAGGEGADRWDRVRGLSPGCSVSALVVDDVPEGREVLAEMLGRVGVRVRVASGGREALAALGEARPDIVFMDIHMPGMDGVEAMRRIAQGPDLSGVKVAAVSASVLTHEREGYLSEGFHAFLDKPIRAGRLYACLADLLGVSFEYDGGGPVDAATAIAPGERVALPEGLVERLRRAAEQYQVTELRRCVQEAEALGPEGRRAGERLRALVERVDMEGVLRLLRKE